MILALTAIFSYLLGSIPFGLLLTKIAGLGDIRTVGSGNIGATNVLRTGNKKLAALTLLLDMAKGFAAVFIASLIAYKYLACYAISCTAGSIACDCTHEHMMFVMTCGIICILGHLFPVWLKFKGGKGVATGIGVLLGAFPMAGISAIAVWLIMAFSFRISSLAALTAFLAAPLVTFIVYNSSAALLVLSVSILVWWRHKENILRLIKGQESKISFRKPDAPTNP